MALSTPQYRLRLALITLLPLYMRSANLIELGIVVSAAVLIQAFSTMCLVGKEPVRETYARVGLSLIVTYLASTFADTFLHGPWMQLLMTYAMSWHALRGFILSRTNSPEVLHEAGIKVGPCAKVLRAPESTGKMMLSPTSSLPRNKFGLARGDVDELKC